MREHHFEFEPESFEFGRRCLLEEVSSGTVVSNGPHRLAFKMSNSLTRKVESVVFARDFLQKTISNEFEPLGFEFERAVPPET